MQWLRVSKGLVFFFLFLPPLGIDWLDWHALVTWLHFKSNLPSFSKVKLTLLNAMCPK